MLGDRLLVGAESATTLLRAVASEKLYHGSHSRFDNLIVECFRRANDKGLKTMSTVRFAKVLAFWNYRENAGEVPQPHFLQMAGMQSVLRFQMSIVFLAMV